MRRRYSEEPFQSSYVTATCYFPLLHNKWWYNIILIFCPTKEARRWVLEKGIKGLVCCPCVTYCWPSSRWECDMATLLSIVALLKDESSPKTRCDLRKEDLKRVLKIHLSLFVVINGKLHETLSCYKIHGCTRNMSTTFFPFIWLTKTVPVLKIAKLNRLLKVISVYYKYQWMKMNVITFKQSYT